VPDEVAQHLEAGAARADDDARTQHGDRHATLAQQVLDLPAAAQVR